MASILYNFDGIMTSLESMKTKSNEIDSLIDTVNSFSCGIDEISVVLEAAKAKTISCLNEIKTSIQDCVNKTVNLCSDYQSFESKMLNHSIFGMNLEVESTIAPTGSIANEGNSTTNDVVYTLEKGDNLSTIAATHNVSVDDIVSANSDKIKDADVVYAGDTIVIPAAGAVAAADTATIDTESVKSEESNSGTISDVASSEVLESEKVVGNSVDNAVESNENVGSNSNVNSNIEINYHTSTIDGNSVVAGNSGYTINQVMSKIKESCENQGIGEYWVDVAAISLWETGTYQSQAFVNNNPGGLSYADGATRYSFNTLEDGIEAFVSNLSNNYYAEGRTTLDAISTKYCPPTAADWTKNVNIMKKQIEKCL